MFKFINHNDNGLLSGNLVATEEGEGIFKIRFMVKLIGFVESTSPSSEDVFSSRIGDDLYRWCFKYPADWFDGKRPLQRYSLSLSKMEWPDILNLPPKPWDHRSNFMKWIQSGVESWMGSSVFGRTIKFFNKDFPSDSWRNAFEWSLNVFLKGRRFWAKYAERAWLSVDHRTDQARKWFVSWSPVHFARRQNRLPSKLEKGCGYFLLSSYQSCFGGELLKITDQHISQQTSSSGGRKPKGSDDQDSKDNVEVGDCYDDPMGMTEEEISQELDKLPKGHKERVWERIQKKTNETPLSDQD